MKRTSYSTLSLFLFLIISPLSLWTAQKDTLVRVSILDFVNPKGVKDYKYLEPSLSEAITKTLKKNFQYKKTSRKRNKKALKKILKADGVKLKDLDEDHIKDLAEKNDLDVVIFGYYDAYQKKKGADSTLELSTLLYLKFFDKMITLKTVKNKVDSSIFNVADKVAKKVLNKIYDLVGLEKTIGETIIVAYDKKKQYKASKKLKRIVDTVKESLKETLKEDVFELTEYLESAESKRPRIKKKNLLKWKKKYKIPNLIRISVGKKKKKNQITIMINSPAKRSRKIKIRLSKSPEKQKKAFRKASRKITKFIQKSASRKSQKLTRENFGSIWDGYPFNIGLSGDFGLSLLADTVSYVPGASFVFRFSPGLIAKKFKTNSFNFLNTKWLRPLQIGVHFYFHYAFYFRSLTDSLRERTIQNNIQFQAYIPSFEVSYYFRYNDSLRFLIGIKAGYYIATRNSILEESGKKVVDTTITINNPTGMATFQADYLFFGFLCLGGSLSYSYYHGQFAATNELDSIHNIKLGFSTTFVF